MKQRFGKADVYFILLVITLILIAFLVSHGLHHKKGSFVIIEQDGVSIGTYALDENKVISIKTDGTVSNQLKIADGQAKMTEADCPDNLCMHQKAISADGETIVCLPNKIVVTVHATEEESEYLDAVVGISLLH